MRSNQTVCAYGREPNGSAVQNLRESFNHMTETRGSDYPVAAIILAAGKSTRMRSKTPKMLHPVCGIPMTAHVIRACREAGVSRVVLIVGHEAEKVKAGLGSDVEYALQTNQRGTGDAVRAAESLFKDWKGTILVLAGDIPLLPAATLKSLLDSQRNSKAAATMLTAVLEDPSGYGRVLRSDSGQVVGIVEQKDASEAQRAIKEWNPSIYAFESSTLWNSLAEVVPNNVQGEYYLTDVIGILNAKGQTVEAIPADSAKDVMGVNNRVEMAEVGGEMSRRILKELMLSGVTITDPARTYIEVDVEIGQDTVIEPDTFLYCGTKIGEDCRIGPMTRISNSALGDGVSVVSSQVCDSVLENKVNVGPFANLRPKTHLCEGVKIGDFVETKNTVFGAGSQASHLSYIGDAEIGEGTNIGAGSITCNYDGYRKHKTHIGKNAFIGSNSILIAPITVGDGAFTAAGSVISKNVPPDALAISRTPVAVKEGWAKKYRELKKK